MGSYSKAQSISGHTTPNTTFDIKINGVNRSVTSDSTGYFFLNLTGVNLTSLEEMFYNNTTVTDVTLDLDTSNVTNMYDMFYNCQNLVTINGLDTLDTSNVTNMGRLFFNCKKWENYEDVSGWDTGSVTDMNRTFLICSKITDLDFLSGWDTSSVTTMYGMFDRCDGLVDATGISGWDTGNVEAFDYMFSTCSSLTSVDANGWDMSSALTINNMFVSCNALEFMDLSDWNILNVTGFSNFCPDLNTLTILYDSTIFKSAIVAGNPNVNWIDVGAHTISGFTADNSQFNIKINGTGYRVTPDSNGYFYYDVPSGTTITSLDHMIVNPYVSKIIIGKYIDTSNTVYMYNMFNGSGVEKIYGLKYIDTSSVIDMGGMFLDSHSLKNIEGVENWDVSSVTDMSSMFFECHNITNLDPLKNWNVSSVTDMPCMFYRCWKLGNLDGLSDWDVSSVTDMRYMFYESMLSSEGGGVSDLKALKNWAVSSVTDMNHMFYLCTGLLSVEGLSSWDVSSVTDMESMFGSCEGLTTVDDISTWVGESVEDMSFMFANCTHLTTLDMSGWDAKNLTGNEKLRGVFNNCTSLTKLNIRNWHTNYINTPSSNWTDFIPNLKSITVIQRSNIFTDRIKDAFPDVNWVDPYTICGFGIASTSYTVKINSIDRTFRTDVNGYFHYDLPANETITSLREFMKDVTGITKVWFGDIDATNITDLTNLFLRAYDLTEVRGIRNWDLQNCTSIQNLCSNARGLTSLNIKNWNVPSLTNARSAFLKMYAITSIDLSGWTGFSGAVDCGDMFNTDSGGPTTIDIRTLDTRNVTSYTGFCRNVNTLTVYYNSGIFNSAIISHRPNVNWVDVS